MQGGYSPYPRRFGGGRYNGKPLLQVVHESLNAQRGPALESGSIASVENMAYARAIVYDGWELNARVGHQWDAKRVTDMLPRWERIFKIRPAPDASERSRRTELQSRWARFGGVANHARLTTALSAALGSYFVAVEYINLAEAVVHVPDATYPWGTVASGAPWTSTIAHVLVRLQKPTGATEAQFYEAAGKVALVLDPILNSFCTFAWYRPPTNGAPITAPSGPSAGGFYLDGTNLDNCCFAV
jgi:hypothetical protein